MLSYNLQAFFIDKKDCLQKAIIEITDSFMIINTYDQCDNPTGYTNVFFNSNNRIFLDTIYCYDQYRGYGIASYINELTEYLLKNYEGFVIRGVYKPTQLSTDRENHIERSEEELDLRAKVFYKSAGYEIVSYDEFMNDKEKYPYLEEEDFYLDECGPKTIVAKPIIAKKNNFFERDGVIYYDEKSKEHKERKYLSNSNPDKSKYVRVIIGSGDDAILTYKKRGEKYMLDDGTIVRAGDTKEEAKRRIDDRLDEILYSKPVALVKKLKRRFKK